MDTLAFLLFCLAIGYVLVWVILSEHRGDATGSWGLIAIRDEAGARRGRGRGGSER
jgi:hypothetical protein